MNVPQYIFIEVSLLPVDVTICKLILYVPVLSARNFTQFSVGTVTNVAVEPDGFERKVQVCEVTEVVSPKLKALK
jgi:hypothetical protein